MVEAVEKEVFSKIFRGKRGYMERISQKLARNLVLVPEGVSRRFVVLGGRSFDEQFSSVHPTAERKIVLKEVLFLQPEVFVSFFRVSRQKMAGRPRSSR